MPTLSEQKNCCAVILSGGLNSRMAGKNKGFLDMGGKTILNRLLDRLVPLFSEILLVTRQPDAYDNIPVRLVTDLYEDRSSLTGIHAALVNAKADFGFVVPCDAPFIQPGVVRLLLEELDPQLDVLVPLVADHYEPLCAIYSKRCVPFIEAQLDRGDYTIYHFFDRVNVKITPADRIKTVDPKLLSFINVNTPEAYRACQGMVSAPFQSQESLMASPGEPLGSPDWV